ncbi:hypothetical protein D9M68_122750 [compost metagenome]
MNPFRALIANDGYAATFQSLGQYRTALLSAWPSFVDLEDLADELLAPREIRRDANGHVQHPAMPSLGEDVCIAEFLSAFGLEVDAIAMEDDDHTAWEQYTEAENTDCSFWNPSTPSGDGWVLLEIFESEDGPSALYARRKLNAQRYSRRTNPSPLTAKVTRIKRRTGELVVQLGHQAPDRMYPGTTVSLHWPAASAQQDSDDDPTTKEQYRRMFMAACSDLGLINEKLCLDPNDGGAEPILSAIDELLAASTAAGQSDLVEAVKAMSAMLESGEWAEHAAATTGRGNALAQRLEDAITDLHNQASANRDMLEDTRAELSELRTALSVEHEPHQSLRERSLEIVATWKKTLASQAEYPAKCPITARPFFMVIDHPELGMVPTYGGPFDSYTIPHMDEQVDEPWHVRELTVHRYDHDEGAWVDDHHIDMRVIHEDALFNLEAAAENPVHAIGGEFEKAHTSDDPRAVDTLVDALTCTLREHGYDLQPMEDSNV